ncbi:MAG: hypothetical protein WAV53_06290 [Anaerolineae bacterium]|nr:hypothetical protein [Anaerolineae bacterium]
MTPIRSAWPDLQLIWSRLQGHRCANCCFGETFRSNGDGQVTRVHLFCRAAQSRHFNRPAPPERWCASWTAGEPGSPPRVGDPDLTV